MEESPPLQLNRCARWALDRNTILVFTRYGLGDAPSELQQRLAGKFLSLIDTEATLPAKILFYTEGVKLACEGSPLVDQLRALRARGVELILCSTCLDYYGLTDRIAVGIVGGMPDIIEAMHMVNKVISL
jgi:sulfur relay (sulfurtransferase) complex TusBCD TusD component (DsrE family)